jgi:hypothetical protein
MVKSFRSGFIAPLGLTAARTGGDYLGGKDLTPPGFRGARWMEFGFIEAKNHKALCRLTEEGSTETYEL